MKFKVDHRVFERFSGLSLGIVLARGIDNSGKSDEIVKMIRDKEKDIRRSYQTEMLSLQPKIESWRKAYSTFGAKPKKYRSSVESLYRAVLKGDGLRSINKIVDIYNFISLEHMVPVGGDDLDKVEGDIILTFARGDESFTPLNSQEEEVVKKGEVVYVDNRGVLCRRWNWRECERTKMTEETRNSILVVEGLPPVTKEDVLSAAEELRGLVERYLQGEIQTTILDEKTKEIEI